MSIKDEITRINDAKSAIRDALQKKGVSVPPNETIDNYANYVNNIQTGGAVTSVNGKTGDVEIAATDIPFKRFGEYDFGSVGTAIDALMDRTLVLEDDNIATAVIFIGYEEYLSGELSVETMQQMLESAGSIFYGRCILVLVNDDGSTDSVTITGSSVNSTLIENITLATLSGSFVSRDSVRKLITITLDVLNFSGTIKIEDVGGSSGGNSSYTNAGTAGQGYGICTGIGVDNVCPVPISGYNLVLDGIVSVRFKLRGPVPAGASLNINNTGAKPIVWHANTAIQDGAIQNGDTVTFIYDGEYYRVIAIDREMEVPPRYRHNIFMNFKEAKCWFSFVMSRSDPFDEPIELMDMLFELYHADNPKTGLQASGNFRNYTGSPCMVSAISVVKNEGFKLSGFDFYGEMQESIMPISVLEDIVDTVILEE